MYDCLAFVGPLLLSAMITYLNECEGPDDTDCSDLSNRYGYYYVAGLFFSALAQSVILHQYFHICFRTGMRLRASIVMAIYQKSLRVSLASSGQGTGETAKDQADKKSTGSIVNLMTVDAQRMQDLTSYLHTVWSAPFQMIVSMYFLWQELGPSVLSGVAVILLTIPMSTYVAKKCREVQVKLMKVKDNRVKETNEVLSGMKIIKLYAWEHSFGGQISALRTEEMRLLWEVTPLTLTLTL